MNLPVYQMKGEELIDLLLAQSSHQVQEAKTGKRYVYGINGIAELFHCSIPTANRIKASGKIDRAIMQIGRKIVVDAELALQLVGEKKSGRR